MSLRPRHVSTGVTSTATPGDGKPTPLASIDEEAGGLPLPPTVVADPKRQKHSISRRIRLTRFQALNLKLHRGPTWSRRTAVLMSCAGCLLLSVCTALLFVLLRTLAMHRVAATGSVTVDGESFTVLVNTFERPSQLERAVGHYTKCEGVESVRVAWSEPSPLPDVASSPRLFHHPRPVIFHAYPTTSINNRFIPPENLSTRAVFVVDDDIAVPCEHLNSAFQTWRRHPDTLVGFFPRSHSYQPQPPKEQGEEGSSLWEYLYFWRVLWDMEYSIVLTKAAFVHAKYLELYSSGGSVGAAVDAAGGGIAGENPPGATSDWSESMVEAMVKTRAYVDSHRNCEDIAMQMAVTSVSGLPPVAAFAPVVDIGIFGGISTGEGSGRWWQAPHARKRSRCLADLHKIFCAANAAGALPTAPPAAPEDEGNRSNVGGDAEEPDPGHCRALIRTNLFATTAAPNIGADVSPRVRGTAAAWSDMPRGGGAGDLSRLSRWGLALRAPTMAEFVSADMLLLPSKFWKWFAKDDIFGRQ